MKNFKKYLFIFSCILIGILSYFTITKNEFNNREPLILYGNIDLRVVNVSFRSQGRLKQMYFEEGDLVQKGTLLAEIDDDLLLQNYLNAQSTIEGIEHKLNFARTQLDRRLQLVPEQAVSREEYQQSLSNVKFYEASLKASQATLETAKIQLEDAKLYCQSDGVIFTRILEPGTVLNPGQPVYSVAINEPVWVRSFITEEYLGTIYPGMKVQILTDVPGGKLYKGQIGFISPVAEFTPKNVETPDMRTNLVFQFRVVIEDVDKYLRQGMPVTIIMRDVD